MPSGPWSLSGALSPLRSEGQKLLCGPSPGEGGGPGTLSCASCSIFTQHHPHPQHFTDNSVPFLPQTQWKVNWMFYAFEISKKWKERRFQPYFNNKCINFYLLTDTCTNFLKRSFWFFFDLSGFVGLMMKTCFKCKKISSLFLNSTITARVMSPSWKRAGTDF